MFHIIRYIIQQLLDRRVYLPIRLFVIVLIWFLNWRIVAIVSSLMIYEKWHCIDGIHVMQRYRDITDTFKNFQGRSESCYKKYMLLFTPLAIQAWWILSVPASVCQSVRELSLVCTITSHIFELESPNLHQTCILRYSQLVLQIGVIDFDLQGHFGHFDINSRKFGLSEL